MEVSAIDTAILQPVVALVAWSMFMWLWMYVTRIPAIDLGGQPSLAASG